MNPLTGLKSAVKPALSSFKSPYGIAVLASVGVHGVLFAFGPSLSQSSLAALNNGGESGETERTVPLVQLSPTEQSRLPNFSTPSLPFNLGGDGNTLTPPPPSLPSLSATPGRRPVAPRVTSPSVSPDTNPFRNSAFRTPFFSSPNIPTFRIPAPSRPAIVLPPRETPNPAAGNRPTEEANPSNGQSQQPLASAGAAGTLPRPQQNRPPQNGNAPNMSEALNNSQSETPAPETNGENSTTPETVATAPASEEQSQLAKLRAALVFESEGTTDAEAAAARESWLAATQTQVGDAELLKAETTMPMDSNIRICVEQPPVDGLVGVMVAPDGQPAGEPELLKSTGYATLNQAALNAVSGTDFEETDAPTAYTFKVDVSYDSENCVQAEQLIQPSTAQE